MKYYKLFLASTSIFLIISCSKQHYKEATSTDVIVYPSPPDTARIQFLTSLSSSEQVVDKKSSFATYITGKDTQKPIKKPYGISIHQGKLYVCDLELPGLEIIDLENRTFEYFVPTGLGRLKLPINCFVDQDGFLYVADAERRQIVIFDDNGKYIDSFGEGENYKPTDVFVYDNKIWVSYLKPNGIYIYKNDSTHQFLYSLAESKPGDKEYLFQPTNIYVANDKLYVSDFGAFKIKTYTLEGKYLASFGSYGRNPGQFVRPKGIAIDRDSNYYVVDAAFENVQVFNKEGQLLMFFGGPYQGPGDMYLPAKVIIDYENLKYFQKYVDQRYSLKFLILVSNNFGPDKINVYGFIEHK